jgi:outer membrane receptor protein involved in Fe transport
MKTILLCSAALLAAPAAANDFNIPAGDLKSALDTYVKQAGVELVVSSSAIKGVKTNGVKGDIPADEALIRILKGTGFSIYRQSAGALGITQEQSSAEVSPIRLAQAERPEIQTALETVTVTAQKMEENIQNVPIAITALSQEQLESQKIDGGPDLLKSIPNMTFSKTNFTSYNIAIRGVGTKAISATTDPAVAVSFNDTALIRNRFFEQEFFDVERVEVLRGPQGTLYGRNATGGVVNIISAKPTNRLEGEIKAELGNYSTKRLRGFFNLPVIDDRLDLRLAGSLLDRGGYDYNATTKNHINGRKLWSTRATLGFKPVEWLHGNLIWEHFAENDNRSRTGKQLCHRDEGPSSVGSQTGLSALVSGGLSQGCLPGSLYDDGAFGVPNGFAIPFVNLAARSILGNTTYNKYPLDAAGNKIVSNLTDRAYLLKQGVDPYAGTVQSHDLRVINSIKDPKYRAGSDIYELNFDVDVSPSLTVTSETAYNQDRVYSQQDYNRFNTQPIFNDTSSFYELTGFGIPSSPYVVKPSKYQPLAPGGIFCDPQLGCSDSMVSYDISQGRSTQFSQEVRLASSFDGPLNFSVGANYTRFHVEDDYYVFNNLLTLVATWFENGSGNPNLCFGGSPFELADGTPNPACKGSAYVDPNSIDQVNGEGHNYFRSQNPYTLNSWAGFGEVYYQVAPDVKLTGGLRWTRDDKSFVPIPSQALLATSILYGGVVDRGSFAEDPIRQHWGEITGRANVQWTPKLDFTDQTMVYASYARGYKGGGANPPGIGFTTANTLFQPLSYPATFKPEFVNAYELGSKNTLLDGRLVLNADVFYYGYQNYQISQIKSRTAVNENFDAKLWGAEMETTWEPLPGLRFNFAGGLQDSRVADGMKSIDLMDRTSGNSDWMVVKPWIQMSDNCIAPKWAVESIINTYGPTKAFNTYALCQGYALSNFYRPTNPDTGAQYNPLTDAPNNGAGFEKDLSGNELPNMPHFTLSFGAQYAFPVTGEWTAITRGDFYWQTNSWARIYNDQPYDVLHGWSNLNFSLALARNDGLTVEAYIKNVLNKTAITDSFLNSDDSGLTTNVFVTDPRLIGFSITKSF